MTFLCRLIFLSTGAIRDAELSTWWHSTDDCVNVGQQLRKCAIELRNCGVTLGRWINGAMQLAHDKIGLAEALLDAFELDGTRSVYLA